MELLTIIASSATVVAAIVALYASRMARREMNRDSLDKEKLLHQIDDLKAQLRENGGRSDKTRPAN